MHHTHAQFMTLGTCVRIYAFRVLVYHLWEIYIQEGEDERARKQGRFAAQDYQRTVDIPTIGTKYSPKQGVKDQKIPTGHDSPRVV